MAFLDLTLTLDQSVFIYKELNYSDPPFLTEEWSKFEDRSYQVSKLCMGTQTGTHLAAPAHFSPKGATIDQIKLENLCGSYCFADLNKEISDVKPSDSSILFIQNEKSSWKSNQFEKLLSWECKLWVIQDFADKDPFPMHKALADKGIFLAENLNPEKSAKIDGSGALYVVPLKLQKLSGSPCRIFLQY
ncbi:MAG: arylformamidase [Limisphaerales bacterium]|jgi:arylformamidase